MKTCPPSLIKTHGGGYFVKITHITIVTLSAARVMPV
jgi:hypothetical protein